MLRQVTSPPYRQSSIAANKLQIHKYSNIKMHSGMAHQRQPTFRSVNTQSFASWKVSQLKEECKRLGLITSRPKQGLIDSLHEYYITHSSSIVMDTEKSQKVPGDIIVISDSDLTDHSTSVEILECSTSDQSRKTMQESELSKAVAQIQLQDDSAVSDTSSSSSESTPFKHDFDTYETDLYSPRANTMDEPMCRVILSDEQLYRRILLMEPISLDEFMSVAQRSGVLSNSITKNRARLRTWLDCQGICFYEAELAG